jgi:Zn-dependent peptidase ImmA (M78 family)/transcriptional regulator with XRE-family HTH domain
MPTERIPVQAGVLEWARRSARLDVDAAASKLGVSRDTISKWEGGEIAPTIVQLRNCARVYGRPLAVLLLPAPPPDFDAMRDFRSGDVAQAGWSPQLAAEFRRALAQRDVILEIAEVSPESVHPAAAFPAIDVRTDAERAGTALREFLGVSLDEQYRFADPHDALRAWITAAEHRGVIVIQTRGVELQEMKGFSISEWPYPVVALNGADWPRRRTFSLLHELAHLAVNLGGLCDLHEMRTVRRSQEDDLEHACNEVAAAVLLPEAALLAQRSIATAKETHGWTLEELGTLEARFHVSSEAILLRLIKIGKATWNTYWLRKPELDSQYTAAREHQAERNREREGGPSYYLVKARNVGRAYATSVLDAYRNRRISALDVADYLDIRYSQLSKFEAAIR